VRADYVVIKNQKRAKGSPTVAEVRRQRLGKNFSWKLTNTPIVTLAGEECQSVGAIGFTTWSPEVSILNLLPSANRKIEADSLTFQHILQRIHTAMQGLYNDSMDRGLGSYLTPILGNRWTNQQTQQAKAEGSEWCGCKKTLLGR
jgi:hypothetical protein